MSISKLVSIHFCFLFFIFFFYFHGNEELEKRTQAEQIIASSNSLSKMYFDCGISLAAFSLTKNDSFITRYQKLMDEIPENLQKLANLLKKQPIDDIHYSDIENQAKITQSLLENTKKTMDSNQNMTIMDSSGVVKDFYKKIKLSSKKLQSQLDSVIDTQEKITKKSSEYHKVFQILFILSFIFYACFNLYLQVKLTRSNV